MAKAISVNYFILSLYNVVVKIWISVTHWPHSMYFIHHAVSILIEVSDCCSPSDWTYFEAELKRRVGKKFLIYGMLLMHSQRTMLNRLRQDPFGLFL